MPKDKSPDRIRQPEATAVSSDAADWGDQFVWHLEDSYSGIAARLKKTASSADYRRAMMSAVVEVLLESGAKLEEVVRLLQERIPHSTPPDIEWTSTANDRRLHLIDKLIQQTLTTQETIELEQLTDALRARFDTEKMVPLEGARRLHRQLLGGNAPKKTN